MAYQLNETETTIRDRRSIRAWKPDAVPRELIERVLDSARWAPSARNRQPWHFIVVTEPARRAALAAAAKVDGVAQRHVAEAPVIIALCGHSSIAPRWYPIDLALASQNLLLAAKSLGLGTCWIGGFVDAETRPLLGLPDNVRIVGLVTLGYPADEQPERKTRVDLDRMVHWEQY